MPQLIRLALVFVAGLVLGYGPAAAISYSDCRSLWQDTRYPWSWGPMEGCMVQHTDGHWMPASEL